MSMNYRVSEKSQSISEAFAKFGMNSPEVREAKKAYWQVFEEEAKKDPAGFMGWAGWEDPADALYDSLVSGDKMWVKYVLDDYLKFGEIVSKVRGGSLYDHIDKELVVKAKLLIKED